MLFRQFLRRPIFLGCTALLLSLAVSFACIGGAAVGGLLRQYDALEGSFTTIALPVIYGNRNGSGWEKEPNPAGREDGTYLNTKTGERQVSAARAGRAASSDEARSCVLGRDDRRLLSAAVEGTRALTAADLVGYSDSFNAYGQKLVVLAVRCTYVGKKTGARHFDHDFRSYEATFAVEEVICADPGLALKPGHRIDFNNSENPCTEEGDIPFVKDERYLVRGIWSTVETYGRPSDLNPRLAISYSAGSLRLSGAFAPDAEGRLDNISHGGDVPNYSLAFRVDDDGVLFGYAKPGQWPFFAALGTQSVEDYLAEHPVWREEIIPNCEANYAGAALLLTDNAEAIYPINTGRVQLTQGRMITADEYADGAAVCLISTEYAALNGIAVGDVLRTEVHDSGYGNAGYTVSGADEVTTAVDSLTRYPMQPRTKIATVDYTVVGIYSGSTAPLEYYGLRPDSIIAPCASVAGAGPWYVRHADTTLLTTLILRNGTTEAFEAALDARLAGGYYRYYDGGYHAVLTSMAGLRVSASWMLVAGVGAFAFATALVGWLMRRRMLAPVRTMRLLGVAKGRAWVAALGVMLAVCAVALPLGTLCGGLLYDAVAGALLSDAIALEATDLLRCAALLGAVLLAVMLAIAHNLAHMPLMRGGRAKKAGRRPPKPAPTEAVYLPPTRPERVMPAVAALTIAPDGHEKPLSAAMTGLFFRVLARRAVVSGLLILLSGFGVFAALFLQQSITRQQTALDEALDHIKVTCTVTAGDGTTTDGIGLPYPYFFTLQGIGAGWQVENFWGAEAQALAEAGELITDLRSLALGNKVKEQLRIRRIHSIASDSLLDGQSGVKLHLYDDVDVDAFSRSGGAVCLITDDFPSEVGEDGIEYATFKDGSTMARMQVIGRVAGVGEKTIWLPLFYGSVGSGRAVYTDLQNCTFTVADNRRLDETKEALFALFFDAYGARDPSDARAFGILIDDETLVTMQRELGATLTLLRVLTPILIALYAAIGFFGSYLPVKGRVRELAVMRSLGRTRGRVFASVFGETLLLTLIGAAPGLVGATVSGEITRAGLISAALVLVLFLCGAALAARQVTALDLMQAMKTDD